MKPLGLKKDVAFLRELTGAGRLEKFPIKYSGDGLTRQTISAHLRSFASLDQASKEQLLGNLDDSQGVPEPLTKENSVDVLIVCPLAKEQTMTCLAFGEDFNTPTSETEGVKEFKVNLPRKISPSRCNSQNLNVVISVLNSQTNLTAGVRTVSLLRKHSPKFAVLSGISGTFRETEKLAHVCIGEGIYYTASQVITAEGNLPQPKFWSPNPNYGRQIDNFVGHRCESLSWKAETLERFLKFHSRIDYSKPTVQELSDNGISCKPGAIISSEELRKDGVAYLEARNLDRRIRAVEMEAAGFAEACSDNKIAWMVFRGHCDFTDPVKNDVWQRVAALSSAMCVKSFLQDEFLLPEEMV